MELTTKVTIDSENSVARVAVAGALNTDTAPDFEKRLGSVLEGNHELTVLDMKDLDYISSAGLRVIFKAAKQAKAAGHRMAAANPNRTSTRCSRILALPDMAVFANEQELDDYLDAMQQRARGE